MWCQHLDFAQATSVGGERALTSVPAPSKYTNANYQLHYELEISIA